MQLSLLLQDAVSDLSFNQRMERQGIQTVREGDKNTPYLVKGVVKVRRPDHVNSIEAYCRKHFNVEI